MTQEGFGQLVSIHEALRIIDELATEIGEEEVLLDEAHKRILAQDIIARIDVPHFAKSAMDGFAVRAEECFGASNTNPKQLLIIEHVSAGEIPTKKLCEGECIEITTGTCIPEGADSVVMVEYTEKNGTTLVVYKAVAPGENVIKIGSDVSKGSKVLVTGQRLLPQHIGVLSALGQQRVLVKKKPVVALLSTGDELLGLDEELVKGKIYDINTHTIHHALVECGCIVKRLGLVRDRKEEITARLEEGLAQSDLVILSGGSSLGTEDLTKEIIGELGKLIVHGIAVKPGKPVIIGQAQGKIVLGLPGYPTSALSNVHILVKPAIERMLGTKSDHEYVNARLSRKVASTIGRYEFLAVKLVEEDGVVRAVPVMKGSSAITTLAEADGFLEISENVEVLNKDVEVRVRRFSS